MNKVNKFLLVIIYCLFSFSISALIIDQTFTVGGISLQGGEKGAGKIFGDFLGYRFIERSTGLGVSLYALNVDMSDTININFFPIELNWEPFYPWSEFMGLGTFLRIDDYYKGIDTLSWRTGIHFDFRYVGDSFLSNYPILSFEGGYCKYLGFYGGVTIDVIALGTTIGYMFAVAERDRVYEEYGIEPVLEDPTIYNEESSWIPEL